MTSPSNKAVRRRNALLLWAAVSVLAALLMGFWPWSLIASSVKLLSFLLILAGGCTAALVTREFAGLLYDLENKPWYAQPGGILFLVVMLSAVNGVSLLAIRFVPQVFSIRRICATPGFWLAVIASELLWVVMLDWVAGPAQQQEIDTSTLLPPEPSARPRSARKARPAAAEEAKPAKKTRDRIEN